MSVCLHGVYFHLPSNCTTQVGDHRQRFYPLHFVDLLTHLLTHCSATDHLLQPLTHTHPLPSITPSNRYTPSAPPPATYSSDPPSNNVSNPCYPLFLLTPPLTSDPRLPLLQPPPPLCLQWLRPVQGTGPGGTTAHPTSRHPGVRGGWTIVKATVQP